MTEIDVLARTICGEARGEGEEGMQAVGNVVMNRVKRGGWWGDSIVDVCMHPYQFSCWNKSDPNLQIVEALDESKSIFRDALGIADKIIDGALPDITNGATHYFAKGSHMPKWAEGLTPVATIGRHLFFIVPKG